MSKRWNKSRERVSEEKEVDVVPFPVRWRDIKRLSIRSKRKN